jgi:hypothetical protein
MFVLKLSKMRIKYLFSLSFLFFVNVLFSQKSFIGIPLLDKNIRLSKCPVCSSLKKDMSLSEFSDSVDNHLPIQKWKDPNYYEKNNIYLRDLLKKYESQPSKYDLILHDLIALTGGKKFVDYENIKSSEILEFSSLIDTMIKRSSNNELATYFHQRRMNEFQVNGILDKVSENKTQEALDRESNNWYIDMNLEGIQDPSWMKVAKIYTDDYSKANGYHIFDGYTGLNLGYITYATKNNPYQGIDISFDYTSRISPLAIQNDRVSILGLSLLKEINARNYEALLYLYQYRNILQLNLFQFGVNSNQTLNTNTWFWRPEIGVSIGLTSLSYAYNLPFRNTGDLKGHQIKISFSYPLIRLGKYQ